MSFSLKKESVIQKITLSGRWHAKITIMLLFFLLAGNTLFANSTLQQPVIEKFKVSNVTLEECLKSIKKKTDIGLYYNAIEMAGAPRITLNERNISLSKLLEKVFADTGYEYALKEGTLVVRKTNATEDSKSKGPRTVTGIILNEKGEPVPGASVRVLDSNVGAASNADGQFSIVIPEGKTTLLISFVGYESAKVPLTGSNTYRIVLKVDSKMMDEVIVTGFASIPKERSTGAVTTISSTELERNITFSLGSSLEGKVAGLNTYNGGLVIRGKSSFLANASPLVVVDGLPINGSLGDVNLLDVESVTVLKDAASASIYGARAANGIIVVTTKSGKKGKTVVDFSADYSITPHDKISSYRYASTSDIIDYERSFIENNPQYIANPLQYFQNKDDMRTRHSLVEEAYYNELKGIITPEEKETYLQQLKNNDYRKEYERLIWQNSLTQMYNMALRKGADKMDLSFSANYKKQKYGTINNNSDNITLNFKNRLNPCSWLTLTYGLYTSFYKSKGSLGGGSATGFMPYERILNDDGSRNQIINFNRKHNEYLKSVDGLYGMEFNALDDMEQSYGKSDNLQLRAFTEMDLKLYKGLSYNLKFQYQRDNNEYAQTYLKESFAMRYKINQFAYVDKNRVQYRIPNNGRLATQTNKNNNYTLRNQLTYNLTFAKDLTLTAFVGTEYREFASSGIKTDIYGYDPDINLTGLPVNWYELKDGVIGELYRNKQSLGPAQNSSYSLNREFSMYANGSISYKNLYTIAGSWRVDQTNLFGVAPENKFRPLWSVSGSWNVSSEDFMSQAGWLNTLKVRTSLGVNGNVDRSTSPYMRAVVGTSIDVDDIATYITHHQTPSYAGRKRRYSMQVLTLACSPTGCPER